MTTPVPQPVFTITDYVDGILSGVALFDGEPHVFLATKGSPSDPHARYELHSIAEIDPGFSLEPQDLWNPQQSVRDLIGSLIEPRRPGRVALGDFHPRGRSSSCGAEAMEVLWFAV